MNGTFFHFETIEAPTRCAKIRFEKEFASSREKGLHYEALPLLEEFFDQCLAKGYVNFFVDLQNVQFPTTRFIAFLIALTERARRKQGEVTLINLTDTARGNFATFSPLNYLTIEEELPAAAPSAAANISRRDFPKESASFEEESAALADIVDPPLVKELAGELEEAAEPVAESSFQIRVESSASNLYQLCDFVTGHAAAAGMNEKEIGKLRIAVYEACLNVIEHAYHSRPDEWIDLRVRYSPERFMIIIQDNGLSLEMKPLKPYDVHEVVDERRSGGFGLHIISRAMDHVEYHPDAVNGNRLVMVKRLHP
jgi:anti-sigma regulatory factor (Ser/Thr protein kinase)/anti-anti-sigma regulatory factor